MSASLHLHVYLCECTSLCMCCLHVYKCLCMSACGVFENVCECKVFACVKCRCMSVCASVYNVHVCLHVLFAFVYEFMYVYV